MIGVPIFFGNDMKALHTLLAIAISGLLLTACDKKTEAPADTKTESTTTVAEPTPTPEASSTQSPTVKLTVLGVKMGTFGVLMAEHPALTEEQKKCLLSDEADATYEPTTTELIALMGADNLKEADKFYATEVGQKMLKYMEQQMAMVASLPLDGEPVTITDEDKAAMEEYAKNNPLAKEMEAKIAASLTPQKMLEQMQGYAAKEKVRCNIGKS